MIDVMIWRYQWEPALVAFECCCCLSNFGVHCLGMRAFPNLGGSSSLLMYGPVSVTLWDERTVMTKIQWGDRGLEIVMRR